MKSERAPEATLSQWLEVQGVSDADTGVAVKRALVAQLEEAMGELGLTKSEMARRMETSRPALDRLLDAQSESVTLSTLQKAANAVGRELRLELLGDFLRSHNNEVLQTRVPSVLASPPTLLPKQRDRIKNRIANSPFFEIVASQVEDLDQNQLVELLRRLVAAELLEANIPLRTSTIPAQINIPDGGEDGRIEWWSGPNDTQYLPSRFCILQSKISDPGQAGAKKETWTKATQKRGVARKLSDALTEVSAKGGSYILAIGSALTGQKLQARRQAIREGIAEAGGEPDRLTEIQVYDANILRDWTNRHPNVALWLNEVQRKVHLGGFQSYESWGRTIDIAVVPFVQGVKPRFRIQGSTTASPSAPDPTITDDLTFAEIAKIVTPFLSKPQRAVRIVGPSGYGKSRLAYEFFSAVPSPNRLSASSVVFAHYQDVKDRLGAIGLELAESGAPAILVVDDCPDTAHQELAKVAQRQGSELRIVTTDVETRARRTKSTLVIELMPAPTDLIETLARHADAQITSENLTFVRDLSDGFPRMAIMAASAIKEQSDPIATIDELIDRIIWGRSERNEHAYATLEVASLLTFVGVDHEAGHELAILCELMDVERGRAYDYLASLESRGVVVRKGDYVEVQPLPLAAILAARKLERSPSSWLMNLYAKSTELMQRRLLGRLRWLDKSKRARDFAEQVMKREIGSFAQLNTEKAAQWLDRLVHVRPDLAMITLGKLLGGLTTDQLRQFDKGRRYTVWALEKLVFRRETFLHAATLLRRLAASENETWGNNATGVFQNLFQLFLSGTEAEPKLRLQVLDEGLASDDETERSICIDALGRMLQHSHFSRSGGSEQIGSAVPLTDWAPATWGEARDFHRAALHRLTTVALSNSQLADKASSHIASNIRDMLSLQLLFDDVRQAIIAIQGKRGLWPEAISGVNSWIFYDSLEAPPEYASKVRAFYEELLPTDVADQVVLYTSGWATDLNDPDRPYREGEDHSFDYAQRRANSLVSRVLGNRNLLGRTVATLVKGPLNGVGTFAFQLGLKSNDPVQLATMSLAAIDSVPRDQIETRFFSGLIAGADRQSHALGLKCLQLVLSKPGLGGSSVAFLGSVRLDKKAIRIALELLRSGRAEPRAIASLSFGRGLDHLGSLELEPLIEALIEHGPDALWSALEALTMYLHGRSEVDPKFAAWLKRITLDSRLLEIARISTMDAHHLEVAIKLLNKHNFLDGEYALRLTDQLLKLATTCSHRIQLDLDDTAIKLLRLLLERFPRPVWKKLSEAIEIQDRLQRYRVHDLLGLEVRDEDKASVVRALPSDIALEWLSENPKSRLPLLMGWVPLVEKTEDGLVWHSELEKIIDVFVKEPTCLNIIERRFLPRAWWGSLADQLQPYVALLEQWHSYSNPIVRNWALETHARLLRRISEQRRDDDNDDVTLRS